MVGAGDQGTLRVDPGRGGTWPPRDDIVNIDATLFLYSCSYYGVFDTKKKAAKQCIDGVT